MLASMQPRSAQRGTTLWWWWRSVTGRSMRSQSHRVAAWCPKKEQCASCDELPIIQTASACFPLMDSRRPSSQSLATQRTSCRGPQRQQYLSCGSARTAESCLCGGGYTLQGPPPLALAAMGLAAGWLACWHGSPPRSEASCSCAGRWRLLAAAPG
eukprot:COSAG01_NODE_1561_length_9917_cov_5.742514_6_plen_156_part_00